MQKNNNPWKDFASYEFADARNFKGREEDITKFARIMENGTMSVLYASSGIGKTSFLQAGIDPLMINKGYAPIHILFTDDDFVSGVDLRDVVSRRIEEQRGKIFEKNNLQWTWHSVLNEESEYIIQTLDTESKNIFDNSLWWKLHTYELRNTNGNALKPILVFDQFEEVFAKAKVQKDSLQTLFSLIEELASNILPPHVERVLEKLASQGIFFDIDTQNRYKVVFSLRKEYLSDFDYWTNDCYSITELLQNRMLLLPLSRKQAERVITEQPLEEDNSCVTTLNNVCNNIISLIDDARRDEVEPFILSVLCSRLYDYAQQLGVSELRPEDLQSYSPRTIIREFYEQRIKTIITNNADLQKIEDLLIDEDGKRNRLKIKALRAVDFERRYRKGLEDAHLVRIDNYNGEDYIELVHDRVADAIADRRKETSKRWKLLVARISLVFSFLALFFLTYFIQMLPTSNQKKADYFKYMEYMDGEAIQRTSQSKYTVIENKWNLKELIIDNDINSVTVRNCPLLERIDVINNERKDIKITNCNVLKEVILNDSIASLSLSFDGCPMVRPIKLPSHLNSLSLDVSPNNLSFYTRESGRYLWKDSILWDAVDDRIIYARYDASKDSQLPSFAKRTQYKYGEAFVIQRDMVKDDDSLRIEYVDTLYVKHNIFYARDVESIDLAKIPVMEFGIKIWDGQQEGAFSSFKKLRILRFPNNWEEITPNLCMNCRSLEHVVLPEQCLWIGSDAFWGCTSLSHIDFPNTLKKIGINSFRDCQKLKRVSLINNKSITLGEEAFADCYNLEYLSLPADISHQNPDDDLFSSFDHCHKLKTIEFDNSLNHYQQADDGTLLYSNKGNVFLFTNNVKYHTFESDSLYCTQKYMEHVLNTIKFTSQEGRLYLHSSEIKKKVVSEYTGDYIVSNGGRPYWLNDTLKNSLYFPISLFNITIRDSDHFLEPYYKTFDKLQELHVPNSSTGFIYELNKYVPDSVKNKVTLYVPYNRGRYFWNDPACMAWKSIREETFFAWMSIIIKHHFNVGTSVINGWGIWKYIILFLILVVPFAMSLAVYFYKNKKQGAVTTWRDVVIFVEKTLLTAIIGLCFWYVLYWFLFLIVAPFLHVFYSGKSAYLYFLLDGVIAAIVSILAVYVVLYSEGFTLKGLWSGTRQNLFAIRRMVNDIYNVIKWKLTWKEIVMVMVLMGVSVFCYKICSDYIKDYNNFNLVLEKGNYKRALSILSEPIIASDTITSEQEDSLHDILVMSTNFWGKGADTTWIGEMYAKVLCNKILFYKTDKDTCYHYIDCRQKKTGILPYEKYNYYDSSSDNRYVYRLFNDRTLNLWRSDSLEIEPIKVDSVRNVYDWFYDDKFIYLRTYNGGCIYSTVANQFVYKFPYVNRDITYKDKDGNLIVLIPGDNQTTQVYVTNMTEEHELNVRNYIVEGESKRKGLLGDYLYTERGDTTFFYDVASGNKIGTLYNVKWPEHYYDISQGNNYIANRVNDSLYLYRISEGTIVADTIYGNWHCWGCYAYKYISLSLDSLLLYHLPTGRMKNLGREYSLSNDLIAVDDGIHVKFYYMGDTYKLLAQKEHVGHLDIRITKHNQESYMTYGDSCLYKYNKDSLWVVRDFGKYRPRVYGGYLKIDGDYPLEDVDAGRYHHYNNDILYRYGGLVEEGWCLEEINDTVHRFINVKPLKTLIRESKYIRSRQKKELIKLLENKEVWRQ